MSFSYTVKEELAKKIGKPRQCQITELAAVLSVCGGIGCHKGRFWIFFHTDKRAVADKFCQLIKSSFQIMPELSVRTHKNLKENHYTQVQSYFFAVLDKQLARKIVEALKMDKNYLAIMEDPVDELLLNSSSCKRAFLRGIFMCSGSVSDPEKSYHLEFVCYSEEKAMQVVELLASFEVEAKIVKRKHSEVVYIKEGRQIVDVLNIIEAPRSLMNYENSRIRREIKGKINRQVNCDTANISKTVSAAQGQIHDIRLISEKRGLESLSRELQETAKLRLEYPQTPLKELGTLMNPPVGKSGVNHRLRKLKIIADQIRADEED